MNIAIITPNSPATVGGVESFTELLIQVFRDAGHRVKVFDSTVLNKKYKGILAWRLLGYYKLAYDLGKAFDREREKFDLLICNGLFGWSIKFPRAINIIHGSIAGHALAKKQYMNPLSYLKMRYLDSWFHTLSFRNKVLVAVSRQVGERCQKYNGISDYMVIPNAVDLDAFKPRNNQAEARKQFSLPADAFLGLFVGRAEYGKGFDVIETVAASLEESHKIVVAGPNAGVDAENLLPLTNVSHEEIPSLYDACDYFVLPSRSEGGPIVMLEALSSGLPVVITKVGCAPEIADQDELIGNFILDTPPDAAEFAEKIETLRADPGLRAQLGQRGREYAVKYHSLQTFKTQYLDLIEKVVASNV